MAFQTMLSGMKFSINGTQNSHVYVLNTFIFCLFRTPKNQVNFLKVPYLDIVSQGPVTHRLSPLIMHFFQFGSLTSYQIVLI